MEILVRTRSGATYPLQLAGSATVAEARAAIQDRQGIPPEQPPLVYAGTASAAAAAAGVGAAAVAGGEGGEGGEGGLDALRREVAAQGALIAELRAKGDREAACRHAALRKEMAAQGATISALRAQLDSLAAVVANK